MTVKEHLMLTLAKTYDEVLPLSFFCFGISTLLSGLATIIAKQDYPEASIDGDGVGGGKGKRTPKAKDAMAVLGGADFIRHTDLVMQFNDFIPWLMKQEIRNEEASEMFGVNWFSDYWNQFADERNKKNVQDE